MSEEQKVETTPEFKTTLTLEQIAAATKTIDQRSFSGRHPELGKMVNCQVCGTRHRQNERKCVQHFTNRAGNYLYYDKDENGKMVPAYRTAEAAAISSVGKPTRGSIAGRPARPNPWVGPRWKQHPSKVKLQFIKVVRDIFLEWETRFNENLERVSDEAFREKLEKTYQEQAQSMLHRARVEGARQLRKSRERHDRKARRQQDRSRRINRGGLL